jgi:hypothetical protein
VSVVLNEKTKKRDINVSMIMGKAWASVSNLFGGKGRFEISTKTAVAGVRGTTYRINVKKDNSAVVKVYQGEVVVSRRLNMEEWTYIVESMQQIVIRPDGTVTKPFRFTTKEDMDNWVRWNRKQDEKINILSSDDRLPFPDRQGKAQTWEKSG